MCALPVSLVVTSFGGQEDTSRHVGKTERHCGKTAATRAAANVVVGHCGDAAKLQNVRSHHGNPDGTS